jgi:8-oxo-dGTP diphosphatase
MTTVVAAIIVRNSRLLICQRRRDKAFPLKWEFPGGKVEAGESLTDALTREISEELGARIEIGREIYRTQYRYAELSTPIELVFYFSRIAGKVAALNASGEFEKTVWVLPAELSGYDFLAANAELIARIANGSISLDLLQLR